MTVDNPPNNHLVLNGGDFRSPFLGGDPPTVRISKDLGEYSLNKKGTSTLHVGGIALGPTTVGDRKKVYKWSKKKGDAVFPKKGGGKKLVGVEN